MGTRHDEAELLEAAVQAALDGGMAELTFGRLAKRVGIADRTLVYYFTSKAGLFERVLTELGARLMAQLEQAFGSEPRSPDDLLATAYPVLTTGEADRIFALWFELVGQAVGGDEPQRTMATTMLDGWIEWLVERIDDDDADGARDAAISLLARLDGALLIHHLGRPELAARSIG